MHKASPCSCNRPLGVIGMPQKSVQQALWCIRDGEIEETNQFLRPLYDLFRDWADGVAHPATSGIVPHT